MALILNNFVGVETGGLQEFSSTFGTPAADDGNPRSGTYSVYMDNAGENVHIRVEEGGTSDAGDKNIVGFGVYFDDTTPPVGEERFHAGWYGFTAYELKLAANGDVTVWDGNGLKIGTIVAPFTDDTWHYVEVLWDGDVVGDMEVWIDGNHELTVNNEDFAQEPSSYQFRAPTPNTYFDDMYCMTGATDSDDLLGPGAEVLGAYQNTVEDATDQGSTLDQGTWAIASDTPGVDDVNPAAYQNSGAQSGYTICDEGLRDGPAGDITGNVIGGKWYHRLQRDGGGGTTHYKRWGKNAALTDTVVALTTSWQNFFQISEDGTYVPTINTDYFSQGIRKSTGGQNNEAADIWSFLLHVAGVGPPTGQPTPIRTQGTPTGSGYRDRIGGWN